MYEHYCYINCLSGTRFSSFTCNASQIHTHKMKKMVTLERSLSTIKSQSRSCIHWNKFNHFKGSTYCGCHACSFTNVSNDYNGILPSISGLFSSSPSCKMRQAYEHLGGCIWIIFIPPTMSSSQGVKQCEVHDTFHHKLVHPPSKELHQTVLLWPFAVLQTFLKLCVRGTQKWMKPGENVFFLKKTFACRDGGEKTWKQGKDYDTKES